MYLKLTKPDKQGILTLDILYYYVLRADLFGCLCIKISLNSLQASCSKDY